MFQAIHGDSADAVYRKAIELFKDSNLAKTQGSRLGDTLEIPRVTFSISDPRQRYVFSRMPAINPAFAIAEVIWIMTGRNDAAFLNFFNRSLPKFAGNSPTYHGAYGKRLRTDFGIDQLARAAEALTSKRESRQVVLQIWHAEIDFPMPGGAPVADDVPCNIGSMLKVRNNRLDWTQVLRSNDLFRGVPYNFIQFMTIQEIVAGWIGIDPGYYCHISDSLHVYESDLSDFCESSQMEQIGSWPRFDLSIEETMTAFATLAKHVDELIGAQHEGIDFISQIEDSSLPECYRDMLCVLFAEAARRQGERHQIDAIMERCQCDAFRVLVDRWLRRIWTVDSKVKE